MSRENDRALRFYNEVLGLERLHYGMWLPDDELSAEKLQIAQERYEDYLVDKIPDGVTSILDVGCGSGVMTKRLISLGYRVEGLSPDITQKTNFTENIDTKFHHTKFDEFINTDQYDCLIMSESSQYIRLAKIFKIAQNCLNNNGYLMICDYFVLQGSSGEYRQSGHNYEEFINQMKSDNFVIVSEEDITDRVVKTLDLGRIMVEKTFKAIEIGTEKYRHKYPRISSGVLRLFKNKIDKIERQVELLNSDGFKLNKTYRFMLLQYKG